MRPRILSPYCYCALLRATKEQAAYPQGRRPLPVAAFVAVVTSRTDAAYDPQHEELQVLLRPVFITSFLIDDFLADEDFYGAQRVLLSSASSKAAFGLAHQLHRRARVEVIGLTSAANRAFVGSLGCYDRVLAYDEIAALSADRATVYVDFAGSAALRRAVHELLRDSLVYSSAVGFSHRDQQPPEADLPGAKPVFFFAPDRLRKRARDWGRDGIDVRLTQQWREFVPVAQGWLTVTRARGPAAVEAAYAAALNGTIAPHCGHVLSISQAR